MREAAYYEARDDGKAACLLCPHHCLIAPGKAGLCRVRVNRNGRLETANYGEITSAAVDPVEKKPLYQFYPGHLVLSLGTWGCNLQCRFCQNWEIAHGGARGSVFTPEQVVDEALAAKERYGNCIGLAFTYSEPSVWYEFVRDTAALAREKGLVNVLVTNGFLEEEPLKELLPFIDAMNIDVKAFTDEYYRRTCRGFLKPVLRTVELAAPHCHVELTTLLVTGLNDSPEEIDLLVDWVASVDHDIPLHFSRYFPNYRMDLPSTPVDTMRRAWETARAKLTYVYLGNMRDGDAEHTYCPGCGKAVIERVGFQVQAVHLTEENRCAFCGFPVRITGKARVND